MTIAISNLTVNNNVPAGTVIGVLTAYDASSNVIFDVGNGTAEGRASWSQQLVEGTWYHYVGVYNGATMSAHLNGVQVASAAFAGGAIAAGTGPDINIARNPTYTGDDFIGAIYDVRTYEQALSAAQALALYQAVTPLAPGTPTAITFAVANPTLPDNAPAGTLIATATVTMSDGSQFTGTLTTSNTDFYAISGLNIVTAQALTSADDGSHSTVITASQGSKRTFYGVLDMRKELLLIAALIAPPPLANADAIQ
jgi:hypothetical protein